MKVLFVLDRYPERPDVDGTSRWFHNTIKQMARLVDKVDVAGQFFGRSENLQWISKYCNQQYIIPPINHSRFRYKWFFGWDYAKIHAYNPEFAHLLTRKCKENKYDLVIVVGHGTHVYISHIQSKHIMAAPLDAPSSLPGSQPNTINNKLKSVLNKKTLDQSIRTYRFTDSVLVVSEKDKKLLVDKGLKNVLVCPIGVDIDEFTPMDRRAKEKSILFTGVLDFSPNVDASIHLVNDIYLPAGFYNKGIECQIAGRKPIPDVNKLGLKKGVTILSNLPDLRPIIGQSSIFVAPMRIGLGMKNKVLEAMAMGKPVVGYPLAFNGLESPDDHAFVCHTPEKIIGAIDDLFDNRGLIDEWGRIARNYVVDNCSTKNSANKIIQHVQSSLG